MHSGLRAQSDELWIAASARLASLPIVGDAFAARANRKFVGRFEGDLRRLHDALATTDLDGRYWVWAGLLLGWAREGRPLSHDRDADFAILPEDLPRLLAARPVLEFAGFRAHAMFVNNAGLVTEATFIRGRAKFEFFVFEPVGAEFRFYSYGRHGDQMLEVECRVPRQDIVEAEFLGRVWRRPADVDLELSAMYGDWRTPRRQWNYMTDDRSIVASRPWMRPNMRWQQ